MEERGWTLSIQRRTLHEQQAHPRNPPQLGQSRGLDEQLCDRHKDLVTFGRLYKNADESWKTTDSFGRDDLPLVEKIADLVPRWIHANGRQEPVNE